MASVGKKFEDNWKKSIPPNIFYYRPPDAAQAFSMQNNNLRFSQHSPCDCFIYNGNIFCCFELKTVAGTSISFEKEKSDKGVIHKYQFDSLKNFSEYKSVVSGFVLDFRKSDNTYFVEVNDLLCLISNINKKSFNEKDLTEYCSPIIIQKQKLKVNYRYDVEKLLNELGGFKNGYL